MGIIPVSIRHPNAWPRRSVRLRRFGAKLGLEVIDERADRIAIRNRNFSLVIELVAMDLVDYLKINAGLPLL